MCHFPTSFPIKECLMICSLTWITRRLDDGRLTCSTFPSIWMKYSISFDCLIIETFRRLFKSKSMNQKQHSLILSCFISNFHFYISLITCFLFPSCNIFVSFKLLSMFPLSYFKVINVIGCWEVMKGGRWQSLLLLIDKCTHAICHILSYLIYLIFGCFRAFMI